MSTNPLGILKRKTKSETKRSMNAKWRTFSLVSEIKISHGKVSQGLGFTADSVFISCACARLVGRRGGQLQLLGLVPVVVPVRVKRRVRLGGEHECGKTALVYGRVNRRIRTVCDCGHCWHARQRTLHIWMFAAHRRVVTTPRQMSVVARIVLVV